MLVWVQSGLGKIILQSGAALELTNCHKTAPLHRLAPFFVDNHPLVGFWVACFVMALLQSRVPPSITSPTTPRGAIVAKRSPKNPSPLSVVQATTSISPGWQSSIYRPVAQNGDCRPANLRTSINWAHIGFYQTNAPLCRMDSRNPSVTKGLYGVRVGALDCANGNGFHHIILIK
jgi:hypothetical protein